MNAIAIPRNSGFEGTWKAIKAVASAITYGAAIFFVWLYVSIGFEAVNNHPSPQMRIVLWTAIAIMGWGIAYGAALLVLKLTLPKKREDAGSSAAILLFYGAAGTAFGMLIAVAGTYFFLKDPATMILLVGAGTGIALFALWLTLRQTVKCWLGAKLP